MFSGLQPLKFIHNICLKARTKIKFAINNQHIFNANLFEMLIFAFDAVYFDGSIFLDWHSNIIPATER